VDIDSCHRYDFLERSSNNWVLVSEAELKSRELLKVSSGELEGPGPPD